MVGCTVTAKADHTIDNIDPGLDGVQITMTVPDKVKAGGSLTAKVSFSGVKEGVTCTAIWYQDGSDQGLHEQQLRADQRQDLQPHQHLHLHQEYEDQHGDRL